MPCHACVDAPRMRYRGVERVALYSEEVGAAVEASILERLQGASEAVQSYQRVAAAADEASAAAAAQHARLARLAQRTSVRIL